MTDLKTLKDCKHPEMKWEFVDRKKLVSVVELREEAKKWIKDFRKKAVNNEMIAITGDIEGRMYGSMFIEGKANFMWDIVAFEFMRFFNISEEELK